MASDRATTLTVRAAVRGIIDFRRARIHDRIWWRRTNLLLEELENHEGLMVLQQALAFQMTALQNPRLTDDSRKQLSEHATGLFNDLLAQAMPWVFKSGTEVHKAQVDRMAAAYKELIGDPKDPEVKARLDAEAARLQRLMQTTAVVENDLARIERRFREKELGQRRQ